MQTDLPLDYDDELIRGHDEQLIGIFDDKAYMLAPDMSSATLHEFTNVPEMPIVDIAYDDAHHVYYVLTKRGLYRSDPVVTSVSSEDSSSNQSTSDVGRPASGAPPRVLWYNILGELVSPPTTPGLYLKITINYRERMTTEKVAVP